VGDSAVRAAGYRAARAYNGKIWNSTRTRWRLNAVAMTENMKRFVLVVDPDADAATRAAAHPATPAPSRTQAPAARKRPAPARR
jgi:hypothetical protein